MDVSICIPTKNGGEQLRQVLEAVFHQQTELEYEVICIDSGSTDGTLEIIGNYPGIILHQISPEEFGHGRTRNLAAKLGTGEFIIFLTQDAVPASSEWLDQMIRAMRMDDKIVLCFGAHYPYPDCNLLDRRDILNHFRSFGLENTIYRLEDRERYDRDKGYRQMLAFSSDNNACVRREVFEKDPYPEVEFAEDQIWTRRMMEKGYSKVYCPHAPVYHSHNYPPKEYARRYYDEYKGIQEIQNRILVPDARTALREAKQLIRHDINYVRTQPLSYRQKFEWCKYVLRRDVGRYRAAYHAGKYPGASQARQRQMDRKYSQQYGQRHRGESLAAQPVIWDYRDLWNYSGEMAAEVTEAEKKVHVEQRFGAVMETAEVPFCQDDFARHRDGQTIVNWVIPEPIKGSGGAYDDLSFCLGVGEKRPA